MTKTHSKKKKTAKNMLVGTWVSVNEFTSSVEYIVSLKTNGFEVCAIDTFDNEKADIFEVNWDGRILTFAALWNSTGRFARCRFSVQSQDHIDFTYTYTDHELMRRKSA